MAYLQDLTRGRRNPPYLLIVVDTVSRYTFLHGMKNRSSAETAKCFRSIFEEAGLAPKIIFSDKGTEFTGSQTQQIFLDWGCQHYTSSGASPHKAALA